jgi:glycerol uptake facilitator-like aquaporin
MSVFAFAVVLGQVSGGHMNPAVSTALFMRECQRNYRANFCTYLLYIASQLLGGILGIMIGFVGIGT